MDFHRLTPGDLPVATVRLARALIGCILVREALDGISAGRIIESEAYVPGDPASHAYIGPRPRTASMFLEPFHAYIYQIYGVYFCFNISSEVRGEGAGVLIRSLEPVAGIDLMQRRRGRCRLPDLCRGPGRLCAALGIDRSLDGASLLTDKRLWLAAPTQSPGRVGSSRRIGVSQAASRKLRFYESGNTMLSGPKALSPA
ncbi:MAG: DNA-3-methyladenine glycosylase [Candidatus Eremiobacteraeota bacterium]|nr:DNA-3-methyladenine glycosylase [Candidatus Eremiobacteraeota bacterium]